MGDYSAAASRGTSVVALVHNTFGGRTPAASRRLRRLARRTGNRISPDEAALSSTARRFQAYYSQRLSVAAVRSCAFLIRRHHRSEAIRRLGGSPPPSDEEPDSAHAHARVSDSSASATPAPRASRPTGSPVTDCVLTGATDPRARVSPLTASLRAPSSAIA